MNSSNNNNNNDIETGLHDYSIMITTPKAKRRASTVNYSDSDIESDDGQSEKYYDEHNTDSQYSHSTGTGTNDSNNAHSKIGTRVMLSDGNNNNSNNINNNSNNNNSSNNNNNNHNNHNNNNNHNNHNSYNNIEVDNRSEVASVHLNDYDLRLSENYFIRDNIVDRDLDNTHKLKLKYLFPTLSYKKLKMDKIMSIIDDHFEKDIVTILSNHLDIIASYLSCQKILYMEASHYTSSWLNFLMIPTIVITSTCSVLSGTDLYDYSLLISGLTAFSSLLLAVINYLKLDAASEAHKISSHQYDKLQSQTEFLSGNTLLFSTSSFNTHTISNRKKQNIAKNLTLIREKQRKLFEELDNDHDKKMRSDNINILITKKLNEVKELIRTETEKNKNVQIELPTRHVVEEDIKQDLLFEMKTKKDEITGRLRTELKNMNSEYDYCFADEEMTNHNEIIVKIRGEMENIKNKIKDIKETNQFVIPRDIRYRFPTVYNTNVFTWIKTIEEYKMYLANQLLDIKNNLNYLNRCINFSIEKYHQYETKRTNDNIDSSDTYNNNIINIENINNILQKLRKKRRYFKGLKRTVNSKLINLGTAFKDVDNMFKQEILNAENKVKFRFRIFMLTTITNLLYLFFHICCCCCSGPGHGSGSGSGSKSKWNVDNIPIIQYLRYCKQKYIKDGIDTDSVLYEILKSRDGTTGMGIEMDISEQHITIHNDDVDLDVCKANYDSDDSDAKLNDWDC